MVKNMKVLMPTLLLRQVSCEDLFFGFAYFKFCLIALLSTSEL